MKIRFTLDERGHRRFTMAHRSFRAFWHTGYRRWTVIETDPVTGENLPGQDSFIERWRFQNWPHVETHLPLYLGVQV